MIKQMKVAELFKKISSTVKLYVFVNRIIIHLILNKMMTVVRPSHPILG
jgi:hypothetical protein